MYWMIAQSLCFWWSFDFAERSSNSTTLVFQHGRAGRDERDENPAVGGQWMVERVSISAIVPRARSLRRATLAHLINS